MLLGHISVSFKPLSKTSSLYPSSVFCSHYIHLTRHFCPLTLFSCSFICSIIFTLPSVSMTPFFTSSFSLLFFSLSMISSSLSLCQQGLTGYPQVFYPHTVTLGQHSVTVPPLHLLVQPSMKTVNSTLWWLANNASVLLKYEFPKIDSNC